MEARKGENHLLSKVHDFAVQQLNLCLSFVLQVLRLKK